MKKSLFFLFFTLSFFSVFGQGYDLDPDHKDYDDQFLSDWINYKIYYNSTLPDSIIREEAGRYKFIYSDDKVGVINVKDSVLFAQPIYEAITRYGNCLKDGKWGNLLFGDAIEAVDAERIFFGNPAAVVFNSRGKQGLKAISGEILLKAEYDEIIAKRIEGLFFLRKKDDWGFINIDEGSVFVKPKYDYLALEHRYHDDHSEEYNVVVAYDGIKKQHYSPWGLKVLPGEMTYPAKKEYVPFLDADNKEIAIDRIRFKEHGRFGLENRKGKVIVPPVYRYLSYLNCDYIVRKDSVEGLIDRNGKVLIPLVYESLDPIMQGAKPSGFFIAQKHGDNESRMLIDSLGRIVYPEDLHYNKFQYRELSTETGIAGWFLPLRYDKNTLLLKYENGVITEVLGGAQIQYTDGDGANKLLSYQIFNDNLKGLYSLEKQQRHPPSFKEFIPLQSGNVAARAGEYIDHVIDPMLNIGYLPQRTLSYGGGYFVVESSNRMYVSDEAFNHSKPYPKIWQLADFSKLIHIPDSIVTSRSRYFGYAETTDGKFGVIDNTGSVIITPEYDEVSLPIEKDYLAAHMKEVLKDYLNNIFVCKKLLTDEQAEISLFLTNGNKLLTFTTRSNWELNYQTITKNRQLYIWTSGQWLAYNIGSGATDTLQMGYRFDYDSDGGFSEALSTDSGTVYRKYSKTGKLMPVAFNKGKGFEDYWYHYIVKNDKFGIMSVDDELTVPYDYDLLQRLGPQQYLAFKNSRYGIISNVNKILLPIEYDSITTPREQLCFTHAMLLKKGDSYGAYMPYQGVIVPVRYKQITFGCDFVIAANGRKKELYDLEGRWIGSLEADSIKRYDTGKGLYYFYRSGLEGIVDHNGRVLMEPLLANIQKHGNFFSTWIDGDAYVVDKHGRKLHPGPVEIYEVFNSDYPTGSGKYWVVSGENGRAVFDSDFNQLMPFEHREMEPAQGTDIFIRQNSRVGVIDIHNNIVIPVKYHSLEPDYGNDYYIGIDYEDNFTIKYEYKIGFNGHILEKTRVTTED